MLDSIKAARIADTLFRDGIYATTAITVDNDSITGISRAAHAAIRELSDYHIGHMWSKTDYTLCLHDGWVIEHIAIYVDPDAGPAYGHLAWVVLRGLKPEDHILVVVSENHATLYINPYNACVVRKPSVFAESGK